MTGRSEWVKCVSTAPPGIGEDTGQGILSPPPISNIGRGERI